MRCFSINPSKLYIAVKLIKYRIRNSRGVLGLIRGVLGCSGGCSGGVPGMFWGVPGCFGFYRHPKQNRVSVKPGTPRNTPEHPGTPRTSPEPLEHPRTARNNPGTPLEHPIIPRNTLETARNTPGTPKIVVSGQTAHELTKPKTSEDSQFFIRLLRITLRFPSISRLLGIFSKLLRTAKNPLINGKNISCT